MTYLIKSAERSLSSTMMAMWNIFGIGVKLKSKELLWKIKQVKQKIIKTLQQTIKIATSS